MRLLGKGINSLVPETHSETQPQVTRNKKGLKRSSGGAGSWVLYESCFRLGLGFEPAKSRRIFDENFSYRQWWS